jgi:hypothetical protein
MGAVIGSRVRALVLVGFLLPATASAQSKNRFALGGEFGARQPIASEATGGQDISLLWRIGHEATGWGWDWGLNWYSSDVTSRIGGTKTPLGELHVRPIMAGYGYTYVIKRVAIYGEALGGYSFASLGLTAAATDAYRDRLGLRATSVDVSNPWVVKPEVGLWIDLTNRFGVNVSARYILARPTITVHTSGPDDVIPFRADTVMWKFGLVYSIF